MRGLSSLQVVLQTLTGVTLFKARPRAFMASHFRCLGPVVMDIRSSDMGAPNPTINPKCQSPDRKGHLFVALVGRILVVNGVEN